MATMRLPWGVLLRGCLRSLLHQASWNFERMQNLGLAYQLLPGLRRLYGGAPPAAVLRRHVEYFNTHPYLASWVAGTVLRLEEQQRSGETPAIDALTFRDMVMAPYAAMGDALFWGLSGHWRQWSACCWHSRGSCGRRWCCWCSSMCRI